MMTSQQVVTNAVRKTTLISRHGLALRVTDNAVNGSESVTGDAYSKYILICLTSKQTLRSIMDGISPRAGLVWSDRQKFFTTQSYCFFMIRLVQTRALTFKSS